MISGTDIDSQLMFYLCKDLHAWIFVSEALYSSSTLNMVHCTYFGKQIGEALTLLHLFDRFILGFFIASVPWYVGAFIFFCLSYDYREKSGLAACAIAVR